MKRTLASLSALLLATSVATAAIPPLSENTFEKPTATAHQQVAFASSCDDDWWKFSLIEAFACVFK